MGREGNVRRAGGDGGSLPPALACRHNLECFFPMAETVVMNTVSSLSANGLADPVASCSLAET